MIPRPGGSAPAPGPCPALPAGERALPGGLEAPQWRAIAVFRFAALAYVFALVLRNWPDYAHPVVVVPVLGVMLGWTLLTAYAFARPAYRRWPLLGVDLLISMAVLLATPAVVGRAALAAGVPTLAVAWLAGPVLTWAVRGGWRWGCTAALLLGATDLVVRERLTQSSLTGPMLMLLAGIAVGHFSRLAAVAQQRLQRAVELEAANRERERLARGIHDSVLQVLALVQRRGAHLDGEAGELARLAGEQEVALRTLISSGSTAGGEDATELDLRGVLAGRASPAVSLAVPADPVPLPAHVARELGAATGAALDNAARHGGGRAWVLVEDEGTEVTVSIRDSGPGIAPGRLAEAVGQGRLGIAQSIRGRLAELGGSARIISTPGEGTEVELRVSRSAERSA